MRAVSDGSTSAWRPGRWGNLVLGTLACLALAHPLAAPAQTVSPPIAEYQERARSSFQLINSTIFPLSVVLEVHGFTVSERGEVEDAPLDTTRLHIKLSAMSFRIPPRGTYTVFYEATADSLPAWFNIVSAMTGARTESGLNLRLLLPHVVYLNQKQPLQKTEVVVRRLELDSAGKTARVQLENLSAHLGRVLELTMTGGKGQSRAAGAFPLLPQHRRWVQVNWDLEQPPERVALRFAKFAIDTTLVPVPVEHPASESARSSDAPSSGLARVPGSADRP